MKDGQMKRAFTIIEVILVLSISSLFAVGMMVGWNINIERQRYNDTVNTLKSDIQGVFNEVENPTNSRSGSFNCSDVGTYIKINTVSSGGSRRGSTNCVLLGKLVNLANGAHKDKDDNWFEYSQSALNVIDIIGLDIDVSKACGGVCTDHFSALKVAKISFDFTNSKTIDLQWGGNYKNITDNRNGTLFPPDSTRMYAKTSSIQSFAILRSPIDNTVLSLAFPRAVVSSSDDGRGMDAIRKSLLRPEVAMSGNKKVELCVRNMGADRLVAGEAIFGRNKVIRIGGSAAAVEIAPLDGPGSVSCGNQFGFDDVQREGN